MNPPVGGIRNFKKPFKVPPHHICVILQAVEQFFVIGTPDSLHEFLLGGWIFRDCVSLAIFVKLDPMF
jgi:hypothetical protein